MTDIVTMTALGQAVLAALCILLFVCFTMSFALLRIAEALERMSPPKDKETLL